MLKSLLFIVIVLMQEKGIDISAQRPYAEYDRDITAFSKRERDAKDSTAKGAAIEDMCLLYDALLHDPRLERSEALTGYKSRLHGQLTKTMNRIKADSKKKSQKEKGEGSVVKSVPFQAPAESMDEDGFQDALPYLTAGGGGGAHFYSFVGSGYGGAAGDNGDELVDLIQNTIRPEFWDVNGGPGKIVFYRPLNVLVIRATSEIHGELSTGLDELRRAGGR